MTLGHNANLYTIRISAAIGEIELLKAVQTALEQGQLSLDIANELLIQILNNFSDGELADYIRVHRMPKEFIKELIDLL